MKKFLTKVSMIALALTLVTQAPARADESVLDVGTIANLGQKAFKFVVDNRPVAQVEMGTSNALPAEAGQWQSLANWNQGWSPAFTVRFRNLFHMDAVRLAFRLDYSYGGEFNGAGQYLSNVRIVPETVDVDWGYKVNASAAVTGVTNVGTARNPIAAMEITVTWTVDTTLRHSQGTQTFYVRGDGEVKAVD
jgi:hypothetical protein